MPKRRRQEEEEIDEDEDDVEDTRDPRDYFMARIAAARASAQVAIDSLDEILGYCVDPSEDEKGKEREAALEAAEEALGSATLSVQAAGACLDEEGRDFPFDVGEDHDDDEEEEEVD